MLVFSFPERSEWKVGQLVRSHPEKVPTIRIRPFNGAIKSFHFEERNPELEDINLMFPESTEAFEYTRDEYLGLIESAIDACKSSMAKVVCSRTKEIKVNTSNWRIWLKRLKEAFPKAFVYLLASADEGIWMGASPELLVKRTDDGFETISLAGTRWDTAAFSPKELIEQQVVTDSILNELGLTSASITASGELSFGNIRHLFSKMEWKSDLSLGHFAEQLHPTPAVCGYPTQLAQRFIAENESYDRTLYTGYFSIEINQEYQSAFVNLRCMQLFRNRIRLYAGGGVNALSDPLTEWIETEKKMQTLMDAIQINA